MTKFIKTMTVIRCSIIFYGIGLAIEVLPLYLGPKSKVKLLCTIVTITVDLSALNCDSSLT